MKANQALAKAHAFRMRIPTDEDDFKNRNLEDIYDQLPTTDKNLL